MLFDEIGAQTTPCGYWVPACAGTTDGEWRSRRTVSTVIAIEAKQSIVRLSKKLDCFAALAMTTSMGVRLRATHTSAFPWRECVRVVHWSFRRSHEKGVGNAGCRRTRSLACKIK